MTQPPWSGARPPATAGYGSRWPGWFGTADDATLKAYFEELITGLIPAWYLPAQRAGFVLVRPTVTIYGEEVQTRCGKTGINAMYCQAVRPILPAVRSGGYAIFPGKQPRSRWP